MHSIELLLPITLLALAFALKLVVDRSAKLPDLIQALLELPVDVAFLATSLVIAYTIAKNADVKIGMMCFSSFIVASILIVFIWRRAIALYVNSKYFVAVILGAINYAIAVYGLFHALDLVNSLSENASK